MRYSIGSILRLNYCIASRAMFAFCQSSRLTSCTHSGINNLGMTSSHNRFGLDSSVTYGTNLVLSAILGTSGVGVNLPLAIGVARRNIVLCYERFATNGTMLTFGLAVSGASSGYSGINNLGMTSCINTFIFLFPARARTFLFSLDGASRILNCCPFTKSVNMSIRFGFRCIICCSR